MDEQITKVTFEKACKDFRYDEEYIRPFKLLVALGLAKEEVYYKVGGDGDAWYIPALKVEVEYSTRLRDLEISTRRIGKQLYWRIWND